MKPTSNLFKLLFVCLFLGVAFQSCDDKNTEEADRDKFIGEYEGDMTCLGLLAASLNGSTTFNIDESSRGEAYTDVTIMTDPILRLESSVDGDVLTVNDTIPQVETPFGVADVIVSGDILLTSNQDSLNGLLNIIIQGILSIQDNCEIKGAKK